MCISRLESSFFFFIIIILFFASCGRASTHNISANLYNTTLVTWSVLDKSGLWSQQCVVSPGSLIHSLLILENLSVSSSTSVDDGKEKVVTFRVSGTSLSRSEFGCDAQRDNVVACDG